MKDWNACKLHRDNVENVDSKYNKMTEKMELT